MLDNKKGIAPLLILVLAGILLTAILIGFVLFSGITRWIIIGIGLMIATVWLTGQAMRSKVTQPKIFIILILLGLSLFFVFGANVLQTTFNGDRYVEIPYFASVECQQSGISKSFTGVIPTSGGWITDIFPENTNEWNILLFENQEAIFGSWLEYYICPTRSITNNCRHIDEFYQKMAAVDPRSLGDISINEHVWVQKQKHNFAGFGRDEHSGGEYKVTYKPFKLIRDDPLRGARQEISDNCRISITDSSWQKRITSHIGTTDIDTWGNKNPLNPGDFYNYITANVVAVIEGSTQSGGWCIFENNIANIFEIESFTTADGNNYNRVNFDNKITTNECCNGEVYPDGRICDNGKFISVEEKECTTRADCGITEWHYELGDPNTQVSRAICTQNKCSFNTMKVDCTSDTQCGTNQFCSRNTFTCEKSGDPGVVPPPGGKEECRFFENFVMEEKVTYRWYNFLGMGEPERTPVNKCVTAGWLWGSISGIVIIVLGTVAILSFRKPIKRKKRK
ncbi:hypothetical protein CL617_04910 [archaeon]|nr:hypothetical protein [archaeon]|tara:strand:- start:2594 stop:4120 length:1527 start_codon:yes stop_codon:yes gene_type:complete